MPKTKKEEDAEWKELYQEYKDNKEDSLAQSLKKINNPFPFEKLRAAYEMLPLKSSILSIVLTNGFLDPNLKNNNLQKGLLHFISD